MLDAESLGPPLRARGIPANEREYSDTGGA
jgi:hypothetical protein